MTEPTTEQVAEALRRSLWDDSEDRGAHWQHGCSATLLICDNDPARAATAVQALYAPVLDAKDAEIERLRAQVQRVEAPTLEQVTNAIIGRTATAAAAAVRELYAPVVDARAVPTVGQWCEYFHPALEDVIRERDEARREVEEDARALNAWRRRTYQAEAQVQRVEALADEMWMWGDAGQHASRAVRATLSGPDGKGGQ